MRWAGLCRWGDSLVLHIGPYTGRSTLVLWILLSQGVWIFAFGEGYDLCPQRENQQMSFLPRSAGCPNFIQGHTSSHCFRFSFPLFDEVRLNNLGRASWTWKIKTSWSSSPPSSRGQRCTSAGQQASWSGLWRWLSGFSNPPPTGIFSCALDLVNNI